MAKLIDTVTVETLFGARRFSLFQGDVCEADAELLALSTQADIGKEPRGLVVDAFEEHFGIRLTADVLRPKQRNQVRRRYAEGSNGDG